MAGGWGKILVGTRLEKQVSSRFFQVWSNILLQGFAQGDGALSVRGKVAHKAANDLVRQFLSTDCDSLLFIDSDAVVPPDIVEQFRGYEPGYAYDALQAFYTRRGWPPTPIWMVRNELGSMTDTLITQDNHVDDVDLVGLHCTIIRRRVFETMLGDNDPTEFEWFFYPRHKADSEDGAFSEEAQKHGFRLGATTAIKTGHLSELAVTWETYQDWLRMTGRDKLIERYRTLAHLVAEFTGEEPSLVVAKALDGAQGVVDAWKRHRPETPDEVRRFYGLRGNGYLYHLIDWNCQPIYQRLIEPLYDEHNVKALVIGAGLGSEVEALRQANAVVHVLELPGVLHEFLSWRFAKDQYVWMFDSWCRIITEYDVVVALDVLEHVHPKEIDHVLAHIDRVLAPGGRLVVHTSWVCDVAPQHYDHSAIVESWLRQGYEQQSESVWIKKGSVE